MRQSININLWRGWLDRPSMAKNVCAWPLRFLGLASALVLLATACGGPANTESRGGVHIIGRLAVVTTNYPLQYFAQRIGGDAAEVVNLTPPGVEAHDFEPTPADIRAIGQADMVLYNGGEFDPWIDRALSSKDKTQIVVKALKASEGKTSYSAANPGDPHIWLDPLLAVEEVKLARDGMIRASPARKADAFKANADALISELTALDQRFQQSLATCRQRAFVTSHEAFGHFAARYGLQQVALSGVSPDAEPSPADMARIAQQLRALGTKYILTEPILSRQLAETLAKEIGAELLPFHPLESLTPDEAQRGETYFTIMDTNLQNLRKGLECG
ncbi:MAG: zinc ABC transporter substrate-binding protein [Chloroflexi bacterium]|nr:zinc ABC transporter substrate-binding protein [Chloroflexota bacterium]